MICNLNHTVATQVNQIMTERLQNIATWSRFPVMQNTVNGDADKRISIFLNEIKLSYHGIYQAIYVTDINGKVIAASELARINQQSNHGKFWFENVANENSTQFYKIDNNVLLISHNILSSHTNAVIGQLNVEFNWQRVQDLFNIAIRQPASAALITQNNQILAQTKNWQTSPGYKLHAISYANSRAFTPKWFVRVEKLHSLALAPVHRLGFVFLVLLATTLVIATFLVTPTAQAITHTIANLTAFVRSFKQVQLAQIPQTGPPELQELGAAF